MHTRLHANLRIQVTNTSRQAIFYVQKIHVCLRRHTHTHTNIHTPISHLTHTRTHTHTHTHTHTTRKHTHACTGERAHILTHVRKRASHSSNSNISISWADLNETERSNNSKHVTNLLLGRSISHKNPGLQSHWSMWGTSSSEHVDFRQHLIPCQQHWACEHKTKPKLEFLKTYWFNIKVRDVVDARSEMDEGEGEL